jgi:hypothetical protein
MSTVSCSYIYLPFSIIFKTFYRETIISSPVDQEATRAKNSSRGGREYLKSALISHPLWEDMSFWDEACW